MLIAHYRVLVGPYIYAEFAPRLAEENDRILGGLIREAVAIGIKRYGAGHEVRVVFSAEQSEAGL